MAAFVNRSISMMSGDGPNIGHLLSFGNSNGNYDAGSSRANRKSPFSPLKIFVQGKKKINTIYHDMQVYVKETEGFIKGLSEKCDVSNLNDYQLLEGYNSKVSSIIDILSRDHMKVAFFGRTSNGKSTVINAMLHDKILPSGIGHTTNCFLKVEGCDDQEPYLTTEDSKERKNVKSVSQLGNALCEEKLGESSLVSIYWPKNKCTLLCDDVVLVDSPGIDVSPNLDEWIDKHCLDADVFVLVVNAESTLMVTEKNFFHKVSSRLSKPNIFILNNRWDASASEPEFLDDVRKQHMDRTADFLVNELKVCSKQQAEDRIFFVSAKEVLQARLQQQKGQPPHTGALAEGFQNRYFEFQDFERKFEECISKSALKTKFEQHTIGGKVICGDIYQVLDRIYEQCQKNKSDKKKEEIDLINKKENIDRQLMTITCEMKERICEMVEDVEQKVSNALSDEIRRLSDLVDEFSSPFHQDPIILNKYKCELNVYVEKGLGSNLRARLTSALALNMESTQQDMTYKMVQLIPEHMRHMSGVLPRREPFEVLYRLNCDNLCADFQEDIRFRFTLGITSLINRFLGRQGSKITVLGGRQAIPRSITPLTPLDESAPAAQEDWSTLSRLAVSSVASQGAMGGLVISGVLLKAIGWRIIFITAGFYACLYLYERLTWTNNAMERALKQQYVYHATKKLRMIVDLTSANCSHQVQQELTGTFARLCHIVDNVKHDIDKDIDNIQQTTHLLDEVAVNSRTFRNRASHFTNQLQLFHEQYLGPNLEDED